MAYDQMVQLADSRLKGQVAVYLRLHWALAMQTSLDSERSPIDWIVIGLIETGGGSEELRGLYASSLRMFRGSVSHNRADELLEAPALTGNELAELMAVRWEALRTKQDWPRIFEELRLCRDRILTDDPDLHVRLAIYAAKQGLWADSDAGQKFFQQCFRESMAYDEVQLRMEEELAHIEALSELRYHVSVMRRGIPREVLTVIRRSVAEPFEDVEADIARMLALWLSRPKASLANIDELTYESSLASFMLYKACMEYRDSVFAEYHDSVEPAAMDVFLSRHHASDAAELRYAILEFCKAQYLPLHDFISAIGETKALDRADREALAGHLTQDLTLHCMITGKPGNSRGGCLFDTVSQRPLSLLLRPVDVPHFDRLIVGSTLAAQVQRGRDIFQPGVSAELWRLGSSTSSTPQLACAVNPARTARSCSSGCRPRTGRSGIRMSNVDFVLPRISKCSCPPAKCDRFSPVPLP